MILSSLAAALAPANLLYLLAGSVLGILIGAAPGLGPVFGLAILLSMTFSMPVEGALIFRFRLWWLYHRHPAQHPRYPRLCGDLFRRLRPL